MANTREERALFALAFALRGTLTTTEHLERDAFIALVRERCEAIGVPYFEREAIDAAERLFPPGSDEVVSAARVAKAVAGLVGDAAAEPVLIAQFRQIADRLAPSRVTSPPETRETLERIASLGIPMGILCNGWSRIARREAECAGLSGPVLVSEDIGVELPAPGAFAKLVEALGLPAECIWYVGNDPRRDIDGAIKAGLTGVWLNGHGATYPTDLEAPARTVRSLEELLPPVCEEYTRSLLSLRHLMRTALEWRDGHYLPAPEKP
jgi:FMN phosphatase YigB (HAD superfamily)